MATLKKLGHEEIEHRAVVTWLKYKHIPVMHFNNTPRNAIDGARLKAMGLLKGTPDLFIPVPRSSFHGLFIEMKRRLGGFVSPDQARVIEMLNGLGYYAVVCHGSDDAIRTIEHYMRT